MSRMDSIAPIMAPVLSYRADAVAQTNAPSPPRMEETNTSASIVSPPRRMLVYRESISIPGLKRKSINIGIFFP